MRLRRPCEHDRYEAHQWSKASDWPEVGGSTLLSCRGGEFLPDDSTGLTAETIAKALATPDRKWSRGTIMDAARTYQYLLQEGGQ